MSKIFDALEHAGPEKNRPSVQPALTPSAIATPAVERAVPVTGSRLDMEDEMACLYQRVDILLPDTSRLLQFLGSQEGEGTSTIAREFGRVAASRFNQRVLLLEMQPRAWSGRSGIRGAAGPQNAVRPLRVGQTSLYLASLPTEMAVASRPLDYPPANIGLWTELRESFDVIVIDALPAAASPESLTIAGQVDGVILVLEAERTSTRLAEQTKDRLERSGARMLGMVFNKRQQHVPGFLDQRLA